MLVFLAHWCPHCNAEVPRLVAWNNSGSVPDGLRVIGVSTAVAADRPNYPPSQWVVDKQWPFEVMADSTEMNAAAAYGVDGFPFFVVVGADGKVAPRMIKIGNEQGGQWVVTSGLNAGDQVMVDGFQKLRPGATVKAVPWQPGAAPGAAPAAPAGAAAKPEAKPDAAAPAKKADAAAPAAKTGAAPAATK